MCRDPFQNVALYVSFRTWFYPFTVLNSEKENWYRFGYFVLTETEQVIRRGLFVSLMFFLSLSLVVIIIYITTTTIAIIIIIVVLLLFINKK